MEQQLTTVEELRSENQRLLGELEFAYSNMEAILEESAREKKIAYRELEEKYNFLEKLFGELSKKENMLIHLEKLSSIGQFISEIVHELNNPLTIITGYTEFLQLNKDDTKSADYLAKIQGQVDRMSGYLNRFKAMAYKGKEDFHEFDLTATIKNFISTSDLIKPKIIAMSHQLEEQQLMVYGDPYQITQIFLNLAKNAFDAMRKDGGEINVRSMISGADQVQLIVDSNQYASQNLKEWQKIVSESSKFAVIEFNDNGPGIPEEFLPNIFDAFFTTKERGKGTGLGLSISTDICKRHNANLLVTSRTDAGTRFTFIMPLLSASQTSGEMPDE